MFDWLMDLIADAVDWFKWAWSKCWAFCTDIWGVVWGVCLAFFALVYQLFDWLGTFIYAVTTAVAEITFPTVNFNTTGIVSALAVGNTFFPLHEACVMLVAYFALLVGLNIYKITKSYAWN